MFRTSLVALTLASFTVAGAQTPASPRSVSGSGKVTFGSSVEHISVKATLSPTGSSGRATFEDKAAGGNVNGQIDINCVSIVGKTATLSGIVRHSNKKPMIGQEGVFRVVDNGSKKSATDMASLINFHQPGTSTDCKAGEFDVAPVKGDFRVQ